MRARVAVVYVTVQSSLHAVINFPRPPKTRPKYAVFFPFPPAITEFRKIPRKCRNSAETGKFCGSAQNSANRGKLWSLHISLPDLSQQQQQQQLQQSVPITVLVVVSAVLVITSVGTQP